MSRLHDLSATEQLRVLRSRDITARELTEHYLDRITELDGELGAFVSSAWPATRERRHSPALGHTLRH